MNSGYVWGTTTTNGNSGWSLNAIPFWNNDYMVGDVFTTSGMAFFPESPGLYTFKVGVQLNANYQYINFYFYPYIIRAAGTTLCPVGINIYHGVHICYPSHSFDVDFSTTANRLELNALFFCTTTIPMRLDRLNGYMQWHRNYEQIIRPSGSLSI